MRKEYFLTAPLLKAPSKLRARGCLVELRGQEGYSIIQGPNQKAIDTVLDDLVCVVIETMPTLFSFRLVLRSKVEPVKIVANDGEKFPFNWQSWAFSRLPLSSIPMVIIPPNELEQIVNKMQE